MCIAVSYTASTSGLHSFNLGVKTWLCPAMMSTCYKVYMGSSLNISFFFISNMRNWLSVVQSWQKTMHNNILNNHDISVGHGVLWGKKFSLNPVTQMLCDFMIFRLFFPNPGPWTLIKSQTGTWTHSTPNNQNFLFVLNFHTPTKNTLKTGL